MMEMITIGDYICNSLILTLAGQHLCYRIVIFKVFNQNRSVFEIKVNILKTNPNRNHLKLLESANLTVCCIKKPYLGWEWTGYGRAEGISEN